MAKVKITSEQEKALIDLANKGGIWKRDNVVRHHVLNRWQNPENEILNDIDLEDLIKVLYTDDFEVELKINEGDWVINHEGTIGEVTKVVDCHRLSRKEYIGRWYKEDFDGLSLGMTCTKDSIRRLATQGEIFVGKKLKFWSENDREVWELRGDDVLHKVGEDNVYSVHEARDGTVTFKEFGVSVDIENIKKHYNVVCFAEDRKDV